MTPFPTSWEAIKFRSTQIEPTKYAQTRNFSWGAVTHLSPYISRGVIHPRQLAQIAKIKSIHADDSLKFLQELGWREYWQRCWQAKGDCIFDDLKQAQMPVSHHETPLSMLEAQTGIEAVDQQIKQLLETGYMHNHARMYAAAIACNNGKSHWLNPANWMYYHLLDGDLASNHLSWQWVAGSNSTKKYWCNQENINKYFGTKQFKTFLDRRYEALPQEQPPFVLQKTRKFEGVTILPFTPDPIIDPDLPTLVYNSYHLDPLWLKDLPANRILLLEPHHFERFPVSEKVLSFILALAKNIPHIQVFAANFSALQALTTSSQIHYREHPTTKHYQGQQHARIWLAAAVDGYFPSYFAWWKKAEKHIRQINAELDPFI
jgi:deoxyribodipyrimidine photo-lyase